MATFTEPARDPAPDAALLSVRDLRAWYGDSQALHGIDFDVRPGETVALLGRNGVGKSTILRSVMGLLPRREGSIVLDGRETTTLRPRHIAALGAGYVPEERGIFSALSVQENLVLPNVVGPGGMSIEQIFDLFPNLCERLASRGTALSGGEQQMLAIARILRTGCKLLLMDEPTEGLAPVIVGHIARTMDALRQANYTVLLVEQNLKFACRVADRHVVIDSGRVVDQLDRHEANAQIDRLTRYLKA